MPLWIPITIAAAFLQNLRSTLQKKLTGEMSAMGATYVRFAYGLPVAALYLAGLVAFTGATLPDPNAAFFAYAALGGLAQIWGTVLLVAIFAYRNFAVGNTYSKTETIQTALFGLIVLGDLLSLGAFLAILVSLAGVVVISMAQAKLTLAAFVRSLGEKPTLMGIGSGACYGVAAVCYRAASLSLERPDFLTAAAYTLVVVLTIQTVAMTLWLWWRGPADLRAALATWKVSSIVGLAGALASMGWFTAMTIQNAAYVRALGQIELVFTFISSHFIFREKTNRLEFIGIVLVAGGILLLLVAR
ncbi:MAG: DMT family transporter [Parvibaculum sp.]|uniref:DMT family transporter n=1 Tax=Parvibaculum sp. TaxID=2024848 RepID=UPI002727D79F|nr:DMT family transporter [Parvibaculum sp.]MDO8838602.1 DMT family transporter [Parvibaculum sp.]